MPTSDPRPSTPDPIRSVTNSHDSPDSTQEPIATWTDHAGRLDASLYRYPEDFHEYVLELRYPGPVLGTLVRVERFVQPHDAFARLATLAYAVESDRWVVHDVTNHAQATRFRLLVSNLLGSATLGTGDWQAFNWSRPLPPPRA